MKSTYITPALISSGVVVGQTQNGPDIGNEVAFPAQKHP
jgi:hypothetical protein